MAPRAGRERLPQGADAAGFFVFCLAALSPRGWRHWAVLAALIGGLMLLAMGLSVGRGRRLHEDPQQRALAASQYGASLLCENATKADDDPRTVTVVTAYYTVKKSKHTPAEYLKWMSQALQIVTVPMVIFTTPDMEPKMRPLRGSLAEWTHFITEYQVWTLPSVVDVEVANTFKYAQLDRDPVHELHCPELFAIWTAKPWMMLEATKRNPFKSSYFLWVDIGSFRWEHYPYKNWPDVGRMRSLWVGREAMLLVVLVRRVKGSEDEKWWLHITRRQPPMARYLVEGTFFGAMAPGVQWFAREFYSYRNKWLKRGKFVGDDQNLMSTVVALNWPHVMLLDATQRASGCVFEEWFLFQHWLATKEEGIPACRGMNVSLLKDSQ